MMKRSVLAVLLICGLSAPSFAGDVEIVGTEARKAGDGSYSFTVTLKHGDTGWKHYADRWDVLGPDGAVLGERVLHLRTSTSSPSPAACRGSRCPPD